MSEHERTLTVKIPAGIADGQRLRISGEGEGGSPPVHREICTSSSKWRQHPFFRREANDLSCEIPLNFTTLALGGNIEVPTLDGHESYKVPEGMQSGAVFRLRGKGMPDVSGRGRGDLFFTVQAVTPKKLNKEQRTVLEQLSKVLPKEKFDPRRTTPKRTIRVSSTRSKIFLGKSWPALDIHVPGCDPQLQELVLAELDDFQPTAIHEPDDTRLRAFFTTPPTRATLRRAPSDPRSACISSSNALMSKTKTGPHDRRRNSVQSPLAG